MVSPNIFSFATSELSQDAFFAYLLDWARPELAADTSGMHTVGTEFVRLLCKKHSIKFRKVADLKVETQVKNIDVLLYVAFEDGEQYVFVIEDKIHAGSYNDLLKYVGVGQSEYATVPPEHVRGIYLRTGNQADYSAILKDQFQVVERKDLLIFFRTKEIGEPNNVIFQNYRIHLETYQARIDAYKKLPISQWDGDAWMGFYRQVLLQDSQLQFDGYGYVSNRSGGFQGCWPHGDHTRNFQGQPVYLQFEGSNSEEKPSYLTFKMGEVQATQTGQNGEKIAVDRIGLIRAFSDAVLDAAAGSSLDIQRPRRLRAGRYMTAALIEASTLGEGAYNKTLLSSLYQIHETLEKITEPWAYSAV
jgi:hypothetical protein